MGTTNFVHHFTGYRPFDGPECLHDVKLTETPPITVKPIYNLKQLEHHEDLPTYIHDIY